MTTPYLSLYPGDILRDTILWTGEQRALLVLLMMYAFSTSLPADDAELARIIGYEPNRFGELWRTVRAAFRISDGCLVHDGVEKHRARAEHLHRQRVAAGQKGVEARQRQGKPILTVISGGSAPGAPTDKPGDASNE